MDMKTKRSRQVDVLLAATIGAGVGAFAVALLTRAIPSMVSRMMGEMMAAMEGEGCDPEEM